MNCAQRDRNILRDCLFKLIIIVFVLLDVGKSGIPVATFPQIYCKVYHNIAGQDTSVMGCAPFSSVGAAGRRRRVDIYLKAYSASDTYFKAKFQSSAPQIVGRGCRGADVDDLHHQMTRYMVVIIAGMHHRR